ncbi:hypothetical protein D3C80_1375650 [compost metagenome]
MQSSVPAGLRLCIPYYRFRPVQAAAFSNKLFLNRKEANRLSTVLFRAKNTIGRMINPVSAFIKRQCRLNLNAIVQGIDPVQQ